MNLDRGNLESPRTKNHKNLDLDIGFWLLKVQKSKNERVANCCSRLRPLKGTGLCGATCRTLRSSLCSLSQFFDHPPTNSQNFSRGVSFEAELGVPCILRSTFPCLEMTALIRTVNQQLLSFA